MKRNDFTDYAASAFKQIREELIDRGWFGRSPGATDYFGRSIGEGKGAMNTIIGARQNNPTIIDASQRSLSIETGWAFPKEPGRDRHGPAHDLER